MKPFALVVGFLAVCGVQSAVSEEWSYSPDKSTTLAELSKAPGVRIKIESMPKPDDVPAIPGLPVPDFAHPINEVTLLFFPGATLFSPDFFKNFRGVFSPDSQRSPMFPSGLKVYLVIRGADQAALARVPVVYNVVSDADASEHHFKITFMITAEAMKYSDLEVVEIAPRNGTEFPTMVHLGMVPEKK